MTSLESTLSELFGHEGVERLVLLGRDGLVVHQIGGEPREQEAVAAAVPAMAAACEMLGSAARAGQFLTSVLEFDDGVMIVLALSRELFLAVQVRSGAGFAPLLLELRRNRNRLIELL